jgi:5'-3' exonuclease
MATILGWPVWEHAGFESDDLIGHSLTQHRGRYESIVAMSNDSDLFQLFKYRQFSVYKGSAGLYTREDFDEEFEMLDPDTVPTFLALTGTHNEIEGIAGVGPKRARKIVEDTRLLRTVRSEHGDLIDRNIELITLPHGKFDKSIGIPKLGVQSFQERNFIRFCAMYNISVVQSACDAFSSIRY